MTSQTTLTRKVTDFEQGCDLAYEAGHPLTLFVTKQGRNYKFFPSRIYKNAPNPSFTYVDWRIVHDPDEIHQYYANDFAVLAGCGPSKTHEGMFWWNCKATPISKTTPTSFCATLDEAKACVEIVLRPYVEKMLAQTAQNAA